MPIFIGYSQFAGDPATGAPLYNQPVAISSMSEFETCFGGPAVQIFSVSAIAAPAPLPGSGGSSATPPIPSFLADYTIGNSGGGPGHSIAPTGFLLTPNVVSPGEPARFNLYWQMRLFFANGGGRCFVVSVGSYGTNEFPTSLLIPAREGWAPNTISAGDPDPSRPGPGLLVGLNAAGHVNGPTMIVIPEACQLSADDYGRVVQAMLAQAAALQDRVAILDLPGVHSADTHDLLTQAQALLATAVAPQAANLSYGCCFAPALKTSVVGVTDVLFTDLLAGGDGDNSVMNNILTTQANLSYKGGELAATKAAIAAAFPVTGAVAGGDTPLLSGDTGAYAAMPTDATDFSQWRSRLDALLLNALPVFGQIKQQIADMMNVAPPSGAMAGILTRSDAVNGVWTAPANIALAAVDSLLYDMSDVEQSGFNAPLNGQAIDIIRAWEDRGAVVWGSRTLDGNSLNYRYLQVRRTLIYIEQSIKLALQSFVLAANDATTWSAVTAEISNFLADLWRQGGLMGSTSAEAFTVQCGLGSTMTPQDILNGDMLVAVTVQMIHPATFIELSFSQTMSS